MWAPCCLQTPACYPSQIWSVVPVLERSAYFTAPIPTALVFPARRQACRVFLGHQTAGAFQRFVQQVGQLHGSACARIFERFAVFAQHHAEHVVFKRHAIRHVTGFTHDGPRLHQVLVLTGVDVVQHAIGVQRLVTVPHRRCLWWCRDSRHPFSG